MKPTLHFLAALLLAPLTALHGAEAVQSKPRPNIITLFTDDQGFADLSVNCCKDYETPHLASLAKNGVLEGDLKLLKNKGRNGVQ